MAITNHERVGKALDLLKAGLGPFVEREIKECPGVANIRCPSDCATTGKIACWGTSPIPEWDVAGLLKLMWETWNEVFRRDSGTGGAESGQRVARTTATSGHTRRVFPAMTPIALWIRWADSLPRYPRRSPKSSRSASWNCCGYASTNRRAENGASRQERRLKAPRRPA